MNEVIVKIDQGDYYQDRGGNDWGRTTKGGATSFGSTAEAYEHLRRQGCDHLISHYEEI